MCPDQSNDHVGGNVIGLVAYSVLGQVFPVEQRMEMLEAHELGARVGCV